MIPTIPQDKSNHAVYGAGIYALVSLLSLVVGLGFHYQQLAAGAAVLFFAFGKEIADYLSNRRSRIRGEAPRHGVEVGDIIATIGGGALCAVSAFASRLV